MKYFKLLYFVFTVWIFITYSELFRLTGNGSKEYLNKTTHYVLFRNKIFKMLVGSKYFLWKNRETLRNYWVFCKMLANTVAVQPEKWCQPCPVLFTAGTNNQKFKKLLVSQDLTHVWSYLYSQTWHASDIANHGFLELVSCVGCHQWVAGVGDVHFISCPLCV